VLSGALNTTTENAKILSEVGTHLLNKNFELTNSHYELLEKLQEKHGNLFQNMGVK